METNITTYSVFLKNTNYQIHLMDVFPSTRNLVSIFLMLLLTLHSVLAADFQKGLDAAIKGDFETDVRGSLGGMSEHDAQLIVFSICEGKFGNICSIT